MSEPLDPIDAEVVSTSHLPSATSDQAPVSDVASSDASHLPSPTSVPDAAGQLPAEPPEGKLLATSETAEVDRAGDLRDGTQSRDDADDLQATTPETSPPAELAPESAQPQNDGPEYFWP